MCRDVTFLSVEVRSVILIRELAEDPDRNRSQSQLSQLWDPIGSPAIDSPVPTFV